jgi:hypothetical protein
MYCQDDFIHTAYRHSSVTCHVMKVISYINKFVFQNLDKFPPNTKNESILSSAFPDSFQFRGKMASNWFQNLNLDYINIALNRTPIYMPPCAMLDNK